MHVDTYFVVIINPDASLSPIKDHWVSAGPHLTLDSAKVAAEHLESWAKIHGINLVIVHVESPADIVWRANN